MLMHKNKKSYEQILKHWPNLTELAKDINEHPGIVQQWFKRGLIPSWAWNWIILSSKKRRYGITLQNLADIAEKIGKKK